MTEKIIGYILLVIGVMTIMYSAMSVYSVFTNQAKPIQLFSFHGISLDPSAFMPQVSTQNLPVELAQALKQPASTAKAELIPAEFLNQPLNLYAHLFLMGFVATIGFKLASLGVMLIRPIVVKLKAKEVSAEQVTQ